MSINRSNSSGAHKSVTSNSNSRENPGSTKKISASIGTRVNDNIRLKNHEQNLLPNKNALNILDKTSSGHDYLSLNYELYNPRVSYQDLEIKCKEYQRDFQRMVKKNDLQTKELLEMKIIQEKNTKLKLENSNLRNVIESNKLSRKKEYENDQNVLRENQELEERNKKLEKTIFKLKHEIEELKFNFSVQSKDLKIQLENMEGKYDELEMNYELKNSSICLLEKKVYTLENEKKNSIKKIEELEADLQKKQNAIITIRNKFKTLQNTNDELSGLTIFKAQSLSFKKQNEDFKCQLSILTKSNENLSTQLELIKNENNQLKAEIKNLKLLKFTSKPISSISTYNIQDSYNCIDGNKMSQVKNEHSTQSFVINEVESSNKAKNNVNFPESKYVNEFPAWWYNHMKREISTIQMELPTKENIKSKTNFNDTKSLMFTNISDFQNSDIEDSCNCIDGNKMSQVKNEHSTQSFVNNEVESSNKAKNNKFPAWWYNHMNRETSTIQMESTMKENIKSKTNFNDTKSLMFTKITNLQNSDIEDSYNYIDNNEKSKVKKKKSAQTFVNIVNQPSRKNENYQINTNHSNKYRASPNHIAN